MIGAPPEGWLGCVTSVSEELKLQSAPVGNRKHGRRLTALPADRAIAFFSGLGSFLGQSLRTQARHVFGPIAIGSCCFVQCSLLPTLDAVDPVFGS
jgi:hypothetical protein